jgi:hypothetical protein
MGSFEFNFFGRLRSFSETFGPGAVIAIVMLAVIAIMISLWRGIGLIVTSGSVVFASTLIRWGLVSLCWESAFLRDFVCQELLCFFRFILIIPFVTIFF